MKSVNKLSEDEQFCLDAYLLNSDAATAYRLSHQSRAQEISIKVMAQRWLNSDSVKKYLQNRKALTTPSTDEPVKDYTKKSVLLQELSRLVVSTHNVKERNDLLKTIAAITQMSKDENDNKEQLIHFYMPIQCKRCNLYIEERRRREEKKR